MVIDVREVYNVKSCQATFSTDLNSQFLGVGQGMKLTKLYLKYQIRIYFKCRCDKCDAHSQQTLNYSVKSSVRRLLRVSRCLLSVFRYLLEISLFVLKISSYILKVSWYFKVISMHEKHPSICYEWPLTINYHVLVG